MRESVLRQAKQNILFRLLPLLFAAIMLCSGAPAVVRFFSDQLQELIAVAPEDLPVDEHTLKITLDGSQTSSMQLQQHEKKTLSTTGVKGKATYQWQIKHPEKENVWVDIYDATSKELPVSAALVKGVLNEQGSTQLRCRAYTDTYAYLTPAITVKLADTGSSSDLGTGSSGTDLGTGGQAPLGSGAALTADDGDGAAKEFVTITIEYYVYDFQKDGSDKLILDENGNPVLETEGKQAFTSYKATIQYNTNLKATVHFPTMVGYDAYFGDATTPSAEYTLNETNVTEDIVYTVKYKPAEVKYSVRYFFQNIYDDLYVENYDYKVTTEGYTGAAPPSSLMQREFDGFTSLYYQPDFIAADGSTVFEVYYERNYYLMEFDCNEGYGADTVYVRYESHVSVSTPVRPGYLFGASNGTGGADGNGWDLVKSENPKNPVTKGDGVGDTLPATMPCYNSGYKAIWTNAPTTYTVAYWIDNGDGSKIYIGSRKENATSADRVAGANDLTSTTNVCGFIAHQHGTNCEFDCNYTEAHTHTDDCCALEAHTHSDSCKYDTSMLVYVTADGTTDRKDDDDEVYDDNDKILVEGDGSTVVNVYYEYQKYTLKFYYAISTGTENDKDGVDTNSDNKYYVVGGSTYAFGANATSNTDDEVELLKDYIGGDEVGQVTTLPKLNATGAARKYGEGADEVTIGTVGTKYKLHYIYFSAAYGSNISKLWPCAVFDSVTVSFTPSGKNDGWTGTTAFVSAWNGEHHVKYSQDKGGKGANGNQTIKGNYELLDENLLWDYSQYGAYADTTDNDIDQNGEQDKTNGTVAF